MTNEEIGKDILTILSDTIKSVETENNLTIDFQNVVEVTELLKQKDGIIKGLIEEKALFLRDILPKITKAFKLAAKYDKLVKKVNKK